MDANMMIKIAQDEAKRKAIVDRLLDWIRRAKDVEIDSEVPGMKRESCSCLSGCVPTGDLQVTLVLRGIDGIKTRLKKDGNRSNECDYEVS